MHSGCLKDVCVVSRTLLRTRHQILGGYIIVSMHEGREVGANRTLSHTGCEEEGRVSVWHCPLSGSSAGKEEESTRHLPQAGRRGEQKKRNKKASDEISELMIEWLAWYRSYLYCKY